MWKVSYIDDDGVKRVDVYQTENEAAEAVERIEGAHMTPVHSVEWDNEKSECTFVTLNDFWS